MDQPRYKQANDRLLQQGAFERGRQVILRGLTTTPLRTTREYFLADADLKTLLGLIPESVILEIKRSSGEFRHRHGKERMDLLGSIVTVMEA